MKKSETEQETQTEIEDLSSQRAAQIVSLTGLGLMLVGFLTVLLKQMSLAIPGSASLPVSALVQAAHEPFGLTTMSLGILLLSLVPSLRVLLAEERFIRRREIINILAAGVVLFELFLSIHVGIQV